MRILILLLLAFNTFVFADTIRLTEEQVKTIKTAQNKTEVYINSLEKNAKASVKLPEKFWSWVNKNEAIRTGLFSSHYPLKKVTFERLYHYYSKMTPQRADKYAQLLLAVSICERVSKPEYKEEAAKISAYLKKNNLDFLSAFNNRNKIHEELNIKLHRVTHNTAWQLAASMNGLFPAPEKFEEVEFMNYLIDHYETKVSITVKDEENAKKFPKDYVWNAFPLDKAPWPLMLTLARAPDKKSAEYVWQRFVDGYGVTRYKNYSSNYNKPEVMFKKSEWHPNSYFRIIEDGGVCGRQSTLCISANTTLGIPSISLYQPGHVAVLYYDVDENGLFTTNMKQSVTQMKDSQADWFFQDISGLSTLKRRDRPMIRCGVEYHYGLTFAMNRSLASWNETRIALHISRLTGFSVDQKISILEKAMKKNPFNVELIYELVTHYGTEVQKISKVIDLIKNLGTGSTLAFEESRSATDDLTKAKEIKGSQTQALSRWSELMVFRLFNFCFNADNLEGSALKYASNALEAEMKRQREIRRSPYANDIKNLYLLCDVKINGPQRLVKELLEKNVPFIAKIKNIPRRQTQILAIIDDLNVPLKYMQTKEKLSYIQTLRKSFKPEYTFFGARKTPHPIYRFLTSHELRIYKGMGKEGRALANSLKSEMKQLQN